MELNDSNAGKLDLNNTKLHQSRSVRRRLKAAKLKVDKIRSAEIVERVTTTRQDQKENPKNNTNKSAKKIKTAVTERTEEKTNTAHFSVQNEEEVYTSWEALYDNWKDDTQPQNCITEIKVNRNISETSIANAEAEAYTNMGILGVMCSPRYADSEPQLRIPRKDEPEYTFEMNKAQYTQACFNADKEYAQRISIINQALKSIITSYLNIWTTEAENEDLGDFQYNAASLFSVHSAETPLSNLKSILSAMEQEVLQSLENSVKRLLIRIHEQYTMHASLKNAKYCIQLLDYVVNHLRNHKIRTEQIFIPKIMDTSDDEKYTVGTIGQEYRERKRNTAVEDSEVEGNCLLLRKEANLPSFGKYICSSRKKICPGTSFYDSDEYKYVQYGNENSSIYEEWHAICTHANFSSVQSSVPNLTKHGFK